MVIAGELEVIQGIAIEEEDEEGEDGYGIGPLGPMPSVRHQPINAYNPAYMDDVEEDVAILGAMYAQQQQTGDIQRQVHLQHPMMAPQTHELEDPRMAAILKNSNPYPQNSSQSLIGSAGYPTVNATYANGPANWVPSHFATGSQFTPPSNSHGLPGNTSASGSPVGGISANAGSPASTTSSLSSFSGGSTHSVVPSHYPPGFRRERSGSLTGSSPGSQSPAYELSHTTHAALQDFAGLPRMGGTCGSSFVPSHHHLHSQGLGMHVQPQANPLMMMMM
jgi:hypothetical protein